MEDKQQEEELTTSWLEDHPWLTIDSDDEINYSLDEIRIG